MVTTLYLLDIVKIQCKGNKTMTKFMELLKQTGDKLRYLELTVTDDAASFNDPIRQVFQHCPNLVYFDYQESGILLDKGTYGTIATSRMMSEYPVLHHLTHLHLGMTIIGPIDMCSNIIKYTPSLIQFSTSAKTCPPISTLTTACPQLSTVFRGSINGLSMQASCVQRLHLYEHDPLVGPATLKNDDLNDTTTATSCLTTIQTHVTNEILPSKTIRSLAVNCSGSNNSGLVLMMDDSSFPALTTLYLSDDPRSCSLMTPLAALVKHCPNLIHLGLSSQRFVNDDNVVFIMNNMPHVTSLQLVGPSSHVSSEKLVQLAHCDNLKHLNQLRFRRLEQVNDDVLDALMETRLDTLISLSLEHGLGVIDAGARRLVDALKDKSQLRRLKLGTLFCGRTFYTIVKYARTQLPHISVTDEFGDILNHSKHEYP